MGCGASSAAGGDSSDAIPAAATVADPGGLNAARTSTKHASDGANANEDVAAKQEQAAADSEGDNNSGVSSRATTGGPLPATPVTTGTGTNTLGSTRPITAESTPRSTTRLSGGTPLQDKDKDKDTPNNNNSPVAAGGGSRERGKRQAVAAAWWQCVPL